MFTKFANMLCSSDSKLTAIDHRTALVDEVCRLTGSLVEVATTENITTKKKSRDAGPHQDLWTWFNEIVGSSDSTSNGNCDVSQQT